MSADVIVRPCAAEDIARIVDIWEKGWHDAHAAIVPPELTRLRTRPSFRDRAVAHANATRVAIAQGDVLGFAMVKNDELYQLYVASEGQGRGVARSLIDDAEQRMRAAGHAKAWLACSVGNDRAARFYEKAGWSNTGPEPVALDTSDGEFLLTVWRFEKDLSA